MQNPKANAPAKAIANVQAIANAQANYITNAQCTS